MKRMVFVLAALLLSANLSFAYLDPVDLDVYRFNAVETYCLVAQGEAVVISDLNGDGRNDVVVTTGAKELLLPEPDYEYHLFIYFQNDSGRLDWPIKYPVGNGKAVAVGDLNNDGRKDIVVSLLNGIGVYYQNSSGTWDPMVIYPSQHSVDMDSIGLKITDINHDGLLDIVCLYKEANLIQGLKTYDIEVVLQNIDGSLSPPKIIQVINSASDVLAIETGDVNNDGLTDIIATNTQDEENRNGLMVLLQNIGGSFGLPVYYSAGSTWPPRGIAVGDINGDGLTDIFVTFSGGPNSLFIQNSQGTLNQPINYPTYAAPEAVVIADVDNDGKQDVIVLHGMGTDVLGVYIQSKDGSLMAEELLATSIIHYNPQGIAVGDINGDGAKDVVFADIHGLAIHYNNGPGPKIISQSLFDFGPAVIGNPSQKSLVFFNAGVATLSVGDITVQGLDASQFYTTAVYCSGYPIPPQGSCQVEMVFLPTTNGLKNASLLIESNDPKMPVRTVDMKGEGVLSKTPFRPIAFDKVTYNVGKCGAESVAIGDVNGDGRADVVAATAYNCSYYDPENDCQLFVYLQNASGQLDPPIKYPAGPGWSIAIGDLNNDGRNDVVVTVTGDIGVLYQNQTGQLEPMRIYKSGYDQIRRVRIGDFNHDGLLDVAAIAVRQGRFIDIALFFQNQEGSLDPPVSYKAPYYTFDMQVGDMNHDGLTDIVVFDSENAEIYFQTNQGLLNMPFFRYMQQGWYGGGLAIGDVNGDGNPDIVTTNEANRPYAAISIASQNKERTFDPVNWIYPSLDIPKQVVVANVNGDGRKDVIVCHESWGAIGIFLQNTDGSLMDEKLFQLSCYSNLGEPLAAGDINGDGFDEIVVLSGTMSILYPRDPIPNISVSPSPVVFGTEIVGQSSFVTLTISNYGDGDSYLIIGSIPQPTVTDFTKQNDNCSGVTLASSAQCSVQVRFAPTISGSEPPAALLIPSNDPDTPILSVPLSGSGYGMPPVITSQPKDQAIQCGQTATMAVSASGNPPFSYQWYRGSVGNISNPAGTNSNTYTTPALTQTTSYWVRVSNCCGYSDSAGAVITVTGIYIVSPNGGGTLTAGSTQTIRWSYCGDPGYYVKIELLKAGLVVSTISYFSSIGSGGNGSYNWPIPSTQVSGTDYKIRITSTSNTNYQDTSDTNFTIVGPPPPTISLVSPNGGESLTAGSTQTIRWSYGGDPGYYVKIELLKAGVVVSTISYFVSIGSGGSGSYNWPIPSTQTSGTDYKIRITSTSNTNYQDTSDNNFTIVGPPPPTISVTSPNGGETLTAGSTQTIRWSYGGDPGYYVKIELLKAGVAVSTISYFSLIGSGGSGSYNWSIPSTQVSGSDYQIKVTSTSSNSYTDTSDNNFTIVGPPPPTISLVSPNGGETLTAGSTQTIRWSYGGDPGYYVKIELLKAGVVVSTISYFVSIGSGGSGSYNWPIPSTQTSGTDYKIRITSTSNTNYQDTSDNNFTIVGPPPPTISVTSPNGGETLTAGSTQTIRWNYGGDPGYYVKIELLKAGVAVSTISYFVSIGSGGSGSYNWPIPSTQTSGTDYKIRITSTSNTNYQDTSDNNFTIVGPPPPTISVTSPNGGETLTAGSTQTIRWNYGGDPGYYVKIELLKAGVAVSTISYFSWIGSGGSGSYNWPIPSTQVSGSDYQIRVTSTSNSSYSDTSDSNFTISK